MLFFQQKWNTTHIHFEFRIRYALIWYKVLQVISHRTLCKSWSSEVWSSRQELHTPKVLQMRITVSLSWSSAVVRLNESYTCPKYYRWKLVLMWPFARSCGINTEMVDAVAMAGVKNRSRIHGSRSTAMEMLPIINVPSTKMSQKTGHVHSLKLSKTKKKNV